jgi:hypothetical protein
LRPYVLDVRLRKPLFVGLRFQVVGNSANRLAMVLETRREHQRSLDDDRCGGQPSDRGG